MMLVGGNNGLKYNSSEVRSEVATFFFFFWARPVRGGRGTGPSTTKTSNHGGAAEGSSESHFLLNNDKAFTDKCWGVPES